MASHRAGESSDDDKNFFTQEAIFPSNQQELKVKDENKPGNKPERDKILLPCTVKTINSSTFSETERDVVTIFGKKPHVVRVIGRVLKVQQMEQYAKFVLDDGTGTIRANYWFQGDCTDEDFFSVSEGSYATINARPDIDAGLPILQVFSARRLTDFNALTHHFLECCFVSLEISRMANTSTQGPVDIPLKQLDKSETKDPHQHVRQNETEIGDAETPMQEESEEDELSKILGVVQLMQNTNSGHGVALQDIVDHMSIDAERARSLLTQLMDYGLIYSTVDDNHFKTVD
ncbi:hypothetical protein ACP70R_046806 [Stipagrostis hirtigluma subsp. patula]